MSDTIPGLTSAFADVAKKFPWVRELLYRASFVGTEKVPTACIDDRLRVVVNPKWFQGLSPEHRAGILAHEIFHAMLGHHVRLGSFDREKNLAADAETNTSLRAAGQGLPDDAVYPEKIGCTADMTAEEMLDRLRRQKQQQPKPSAGEKAGGKDAEPSASGSGGGAANGEDSGGASGSAGEGKEDSGASAGSGSGSSDSGADDGASGSGGDSGDSGETAGVGNRGVHGDGPWTEDAAKVPGVDPGTAEKARRDVLEKILQAVESGDTTIGSIPGSVIREARRLRAPIPWSRVLAGAISSAVGRTRNGWAVRKPHPAVVRDMALPTLSRARSSRVVIIGDTSGSMTAAMLGRVIDIVIGAADRAEVIFIAADSTVQSIQRIRRGQMPRLVGGGGTDFRPAFDAAAKMRPAVVVIVTDTYGDWPAERPSFPVWGVVPAGAIYKATPGWVRLIKTDFQQ